MLYCLLWQPTKKKRAKECLQYTMRNFSTVLLLTYPMNEIGYTGRGHEPCLAVYLQNGVDWPCPKMVWLNADVNTDTKFSISHHPTPL